jgi:hypothetical protein
VSAELTTDQKGAIAETAVALAALKLGVDVYRPVAEGGRYDLIFDVGDRLLRVQCKWAIRSGEVVSVPCRTCRRGRQGLVRRTYTSDDADAIGAYCADLDRCFLLPLDLFSGWTAIQLRLAPARNGQRAKVNWAERFELAATLGRSPGAIAQLGERRAGSAKVAGSSPAGSIR